MHHFYKILQEQQEKEKKIIEEFNGNRKESNLNTLEMISKLGFNWNGYLAEKFSSKLIDKCKKFILGDIAQPHSIHPTGRNSIQFEYKTDDAYLEFEIYEDKITYFIIIGDIKGENIHTEKTVEDKSEYDNKIVNIPLMSKVFALGRYNNIYTSINYKGLNYD